jgi:hypothetical protein
MGFETMSLVVFKWDIDHLSLNGGECSNYNLGA